MYFLQVQTISQFGLGKLRSDKASIFYNTTSAGRFGNYFFILVFMNFGDSLVPLLKLYCNRTNLRDKVLRDDLLTHRLGLHAVFYV